MKLENQEKIFTAFKEGDEKAFRRIFDHYGVSTTKLVRTITGSGAEVIDIVADVFSIAWKKRVDFESLENLVSFIGVTAYRMATRYVQSRQDPARFIGIFKKFLHSRETNDGEDLNLEELQRVKSSMEKLPLKLKEVISLAFFEGLKNEEIARRLHSSEKTIRNQKSEAIKRLKKDLL